MNPSSQPYPCSMYPSSHQPQRLSAMASQGSLTRYCSAPGSLLTSTVNSVIGGSGDQQFDAMGSESMMGRFFSADLSSLTSEPGCKPDVPPDLNEAYRGQDSARVGGASSSSAGLQRSYGFNDIAVGDFGTSSFTGGGGGGSVGNAASAAVAGGVPSSLTRHSSSPASFLNHLLADNNDFSITRGRGSYSSQTNGGLESQLSFTSGKESLSRISEVSDQSGIGGCSSGSSSFPVGSWNETHSIFFSNPSNKRAKIVHGDILTGLDGLDTQFNLSSSSLEMASVEKYPHMNQDHVQCRTRAKRGFATHPRSIAERERRTRISEKLKKLQELVPNMDKQTNTADMLDLAVQHIKSLQSQVQKLNKNIANCTCGCKKEK